MKWTREEKTRRNGLYGYMENTLAVCTRARTWRVVQGARTFKPPLVTTTEPGSTPMPPDEPNRKYVTSVACSAPRITSSNV